MDTVKQLLFQGIPGVRNHQELKEYILQHGCYRLEENLRIYEKWFANAPRYLFRAVDRKYRITQRTLCDIGCAYGMNLIFSFPGSYGIENNEYEVRFARSLGLILYQRDVLEDDLSDLPKVEIVWCSAVLEHVDSPHIFLRKLHSLLVDGGLLALYVPTIPLFSSLRHIPRLGRYFSGHLAADHVNFFTPKTLTCFCERAGFRTIEVSPFYPAWIGFANYFPILRRLVDGCVYVGEKMRGWNYSPKATRRATTNNARGFVFVRQRFPDKYLNE